MGVPLILALCTPDEFVNPYPALFWSAAVCAGLLGLEAFVFFLTARNFYQVCQALWFSRIRRLLNILAMCTALLALVLAAWLDWQRLHFVTFCSIGGYNPPYRAFQAGQAAVMVVISFTAIFIIGGLVLLASQFWLSKTVQRAR
jgi:hypothetical protein